MRKNTCLNPAHKSRRQFMPKRAVNLGDLEARVDTFALGKGTRQNYDIKRIMYFTPRQLSDYLGISINNLSRRLNLTRVRVTDWFTKEEEIDSNLVISFYKSLIDSYSIPRRRPGFFDGTNGQIRKNIIVKYLVEDVLKRPVDQKLIKTFRAFFKRNYLKYKLGLLGKDAKSLLLCAYPELEYLNGSLRSKFQSEMANCTRPGVSKFLKEVFYSTLEDLAARYDARKATISGYLIELGIEQEQWFMSEEVIDPQLVINYYDSLLKNQTTCQIPKGFSQGKNGLERQKIIAKYLIEDILKLSIADKDFPSKLKKEVNDKEKSRFRLSVFTRNEETFALYLAKLLYPDLLFDPKHPYKPHIWHEWDFRHKHFQTEEEARTCVDHLILEQFGINRESSVREKLIVLNKIADEGYDATIFKPGIRRYLQVDSPREFKKWWDPKLCYELEQRILREVLNNTFNKSHDEIQRLFVNSESPRIGQSILSLKKRHSLRTAELKDKSYISDKNFNEIMRDIVSACGKLSTKPFENYAFWEYSLAQWSANPTYNIEIFYDDGCHVERFNVFLKLYATKKERDEEIVLSQLLTQHGLDVISMEKGRHKVKNGVKYQRSSGRSDKLTYQSNGIKRGPKYCSHVGFSDFVKGHSLDVEFYDDLQGFNETLYAETLSNLNSTVANFQIEGYCLKKHLSVKRRKRDYFNHFIENCLNFDWISENQGIDLLGFIHENLITDIEDYATDEENNVLVHGDLHPNNVLVNEDGEYKLTDLGSVHVGVPQEDLTRYIGNYFTRMQHNITEETISMLIDDSFNKLSRHRRLDKTKFIEMFNKVGLYNDILLSAYWKDKVLHSSQEESYEDTQVKCSESALRYAKKAFNEEQFLEFKHLFLSIF